VGKVERFIYIWSRSIKQKRFHRAFYVFMSQDTEVLYFSCWLAANGLLSLTDLMCRTEDLLSLQFVCLVPSLHGLFVDGPFGRN